jgi:hypothetical protein
VPARRRGGSAADCPPAGAAAVRRRPLALPPAGRGHGDLGHHRCDQSRDGPPGASTNGRTKRTIKYWGIPPGQDAECVAGMDEGLDTSAAAYEPRHPVWGMDDQPVQLLKETRGPIAATQQHGRRVDDAYERNGTASIFLFAEPRSGFRHAPAYDGPRPTGQSKSRSCGTRAMPIARTCPSCATTATRTPKERSMKRSSQPVRERIANVSTSAIPRNTAGGSMSPHATGVAERASASATITSAHGPDCKPTLPLAPTKHMPTNAASTGNGASKTPA